MSGSDVIILPSEVRGKYRNEPENFYFPNNCTLKYSWRLFSPL
jgi:hypothetical protein